MPKFRDEDDHERSYDLDRLTYRHEAIILWLLGNPHRTLKECAAAFNYTQTHLSIIINSGIFRERYALMREEYDGEVITTMTDKLKAIADVSLDKLMDQLDEIEDPVFLRETACKTLDRLGYGRSKGPTININNPGEGSVTVNVADKGMLAQARAKRATMQLQLEAKRQAEFDDSIEGEFKEVANGKLTKEN